MLHAGADDVDDPSVATLFHARHHGQRQRLERQQVLPERALESGHFAFVRPPRRWSAGVVDQDVHRADRFAVRIDRRGEPRRIGHVNGQHRVLLPG